MSNAFFMFLAMVGLVAFLAIGPWVKLMTAADDKARLRALPMAATGTVLFLGVFVLFGIVTALTELI